MENYYEIDDVVRASKMVRVDHHSIRSSALACNIPYATLRRKIQSGDFSIRTKGSPTYFSKEEECKLVDWIIEQAESG